MTTAQHPPGPHPAGPRAVGPDPAGPRRDRGFRRAYRASDDVLVGGVASGLAEHLAVPVLWARLGFVAATFIGGFGVFMYAGLWLVLPVADSNPEAPGLAAASRDGRRPHRIRRLLDGGPSVALGMLVVGALAIVGLAMPGLGSWWPVLLGLFGLVLLWRQADEAQRERWLDTSGRVNPARVILGSGGWPAYLRIAGGLILLVVAVVVLGARDATPGTIGGVLSAVMLMLLGLAVVVGPWVFRVAADLSNERTERLRSQDRADMAAHLHDSVLQTLALIQKNAHDAPTVARLARGQERDLRAWLFADDMPEVTLAAAIKEAAAAVEDSYGIEVEVVVVGDRPLTEPLRPILEAAREAMTNAAKHSGVTRTDVYAEVGGEQIEVFVRDRGTGFDPDRVAEDRQGVRGSILDRMDRHGGRAVIRSAAGEGTEVRLLLPCPAEEDDR